MSDPKSNASKCLEEKDRMTHGMLRLMGHGYLVVFLFFAVFFLLLTEAGKLSPGLGQSSMTPPHGRC